MITTIIILLFLMIGAGITRRNHYIQEVPMTIGTWLGTFVTYWLAVCYAMWVNLTDAIVSKKTLSERYMTITEQEEFLKKVFEEEEDETQKQ